MTRKCQGRQPIISPYLSCQLKTLGQSRAPVPKVGAFLTKEKDYG